MCSYLRRGMGLQVNEIYIYASICTACVANCVNIHLDTNTNILSPKRFIQAARVGVFNIIHHLFI